jgi:hypothetical protein
MNNTTSLPGNDVLVPLIAAQAKKLAASRALLQKRHGASMGASMNAQLSAIYLSLQMIEKAWLAEASIHEAKLRLPMPQGRSPHE